MPPRAHGLCAVKRTVSLYYRRGTLFCLVLFYLRSFAFFARAQHYATFLVYCGYAAAAREYAFAARTHCAAHATAHFATTARCALPRASILWFCWRFAPTIAVHLTRRALSRILFALYGSTTLPALQFWLNL